MPFCSKCGTKAKDGAKFCSACGAQLVLPKAPVTSDAPVAPQAAEATPAPSADLQAYAKFANVTVRYRCSCGNAFDGNDATASCPKCGAAISKGGTIQLYRMGNMMGVAVGMGIYIDEVSYGFIANKQSLRINVPFGAHKVHVVHTATRACNDPVITVTPEKPYAFCRASFAGAGFRINVEEVGADVMPVR